MAHNSAPPPSNRREEPDPFIITDREIAECITDIGMSFSVEDLRKPQPHDIQRLFEYFGSVLLNLSREVVNPAMRAAAEEMAGGEADRLYSSDTRDLMGMFIMLRRLMLECSITDFSLNDLYKPTYPRLQKILSYIINFVRFRENHTAVVDQYFAEVERTKLHVQQLYNDKENLEARLTQLQRDQPSIQKAIVAKEAELAVVKPRLLDLDDKKRRLVEDLRKAEAEKKRLLTLLETRSRHLDTVQAESAKLKPYTLQKPDAIEASLQDLNSTVGTEKTQLEVLGRRLRALATSSESFASVSTEITNTMRLLADLGGDLAREEEDLSEAAKYREALSEKTNTVHEIERTEKLMTKQLEAVQARTDKLRLQAEGRNEEASRKMEEKKAEYSQMSQEKGEKDREVERKRVKIEQMEKKMTDLKVSLEKEVETAREEYMKMDSHIRLYVDEMEQFISR